MTPARVHGLADVSWVLHDGIAYVFPAPVEVRLENRPVTGYWSHINHRTHFNQYYQKDLGETDGEVFLLWLNHGIKPDNAGYAYIVVPGIDAAGMHDYQRRRTLDEPWIRSSPCGDFAEAVNALYELGDR